MRLCGGSIFARSWGSPRATTILCWHGAGGSSEDYAEIGPELADRLGALVVAIDAPGHAQSAARPAEPFRPTPLAALATEILDELGVERTVFVGFSWGASVGCWLAALHPERVHALVLVEGGHLDFVDLPGFPKDVTLEQLVSEAEVVARQEGAAFGSHTPAIAGAMIHGLCQEPTSAAYARIAAAGTPALFVGAGEDELSVWVERLVRHVPQTEAVQLASSGHDLLREDPRAVTRVVGDWLA